MLKSLAGVSRDDEMEEVVETESRTERKTTTSTSSRKDSEAPSAAGPKLLLLE